MVPKMEYSICHDRMTLKSRLAFQVALRMPSGGPPDIMKLELSSAIKVEMEMRPRKTKERTDKRQRNKKRLRSEAREV